MPNSPPGSSPRAGATSAQTLERGLSFLFLAAVVSGLSLTSAFGGPINSHKVPTAPADRGPETLGQLGYPEPLPAVATQVTGGDDAGRKLLTQQIAQGSSPQGKVPSRPWLIPAQAGGPAPAPEKKPGGFSTIPEPASLLLFLTGILGLLFRRRLLRARG